MELGTQLKDPRIGISIDCDDFPSFDNLMWTLGRNPKQKNEEISSAV